MKPKNLLPRLTAPVSRGDSQATIGRLQFKAGVSGSYFSTGNCAWSCYQYQTVGGRQVQIPDTLCVLEKCAGDYILNKVRNSTADPYYVRAIEDLKYKGVI